MKHNNLRSWTLVAALCIVVCVAAGALYGYWHHAGTTREHETPTNSMSQTGPSKSIDIDHLLIDTDSK
jgi:hypothetical protein